MTDNLPVVRASLSANPNLTRLTFDEMQRFAKGFELAGTFEGKNYKPATMAELFVRIAAGQAMGIDPFTAVTEMYMVKGKLSMSTNLQLGLAKATGKYRYRISFGDLPPEQAKPEWPSPQWCKFVVYENEDGQWNEIGETTWSLLDSERAGLLKPSRNGEPSNHLTYNRAMLKNRAGSQAVNFFMPDATMVRIYDQGELPDDDRPLSAVTATQTTSTATTTGVQGAPGETHDVPEEEIQEADVVTESARPNEARDDFVAGEVKPGETANEAMARMVGEEAQGYPFDPNTEPPPIVPEAPPTVVMDENVRTITPKQVSYAHVLARDAQLDDETRKRIMLETTGVEHTDRIPFDKFQDFVAELVSIANQIKRTPAVKGEE